MLDRFLVVELRIDRGGDLVPDCFLLVELRIGGGGGLVLERFLVVDLRNPLNSPTSPTLMPLNDIADTNNNVAAITQITDKDAQELSIEYRSGTIPRFTLELPFWVKALRNKPNPQ